jgi:hypothetical protein
MKKIKKCGIQRMLVVVMMSIISIFIISCGNSDEKRDYEKKIIKLVEGKFNISEERIVVALETALAENATLENVVEKNAWKSRAERRNTKDFLRELGIKHRQYDDDFENELKQLIANYQDKWLKQYALTNAEYNQLWGDDTSILIEDVKKIITEAELDEFDKALTTLIDEWDSFVEYMDKDALKSEISNLKTQRTALEIAKSNSDTKQSKKIDKVIKKIDKVVAKYEKKLRSL